MDLDQEWGILFFVNKYNLKNLSLELSKPLLLFQKIISETTFIKRIIIRLIPKTG